MESISSIERLKSFSSFKQDIKENRLFHSIMLINKDGEFLYQYALRLAGEILSSGQERVAETKIKVNKEIHPDLFVFGKDKPLDTAVCKDLISSVYVAPYEGEKKVYIISRFDEMLPSPANKLLKTLEEPPKGVVFLLLVKNTSRVLQTLLSRAQKFYLEGFSGEDVTNILKEQGVDNAELLSLETDSSLEASLMLGKSQNPKSMANFVINTFSNFKLTTDFSKILEKAEEFRGSEKELLNFFSLVADLVLRAKSGLTAKRSGHIEKDVIMLSRMWNEKALVLVIEATINCLKMLESNVIGQNVMDQFFLKFLEVRRKCRVFWEYN